MKAEKNACALATRIWIFFFSVFNITKCHISSKQLIKLHHVNLWMQMQFRASAFDKMEIEPAEHIIIPDGRAK